MNNLTPVCTAGQQFYGLHDRSRLLSTSSVRGISVRSGHLTKLSVVVVNLASSVFSRPLCTSQRRQRPLPHARARRRGAPPHRRSTATIHPSSPMGVRARPPSLPRPSVRPSACACVQNCDESVQAAKNPTRLRAVHEDLYNTLSHSIPPRPL